MPKLDGAEFARRYRSQASDRRLPNVALMANASEDVKRAFLEAGMDALLAKPVSPRLLWETIARLALHPRSPRGHSDPAVRPPVKPR